VKIPDKKWIIAVVAAAVLFRLGFYLFALQKLPVSSDEAWPSLMAMHMLKGEFPIVYWGQTYMGTQESAVQAVWIALLGPHTWVVRMYPLLFGFLYVAASALLAARFYNRQVAWLVLLLLAVPVPYLTMCSVLIPPDNYLALTTLGSFSLVLLHDLVFGREPASWKKYALLGFLLGFTFWLHILVLSYIGVALLFLFLKDKLVWIRGKFWAGVLGFVVGALPLLWFNVKHHFVTFSDVGRTVDLQRSWELLQELFIVTLHFLIGMKVMLYGDNPHFVPLPPVLAVALGVTWLAVILLVLGVRFKSLLRMAVLSVQRSEGTAILVVTAAASMFVFCRSSRSGWDNVRYVLPIVSVLPVLLAYGLWRIGEKSRAALWALALLVMGAQAWGNVLLAREWSKPNVVSVDLDLPDTQGLFRFLNEQGIRRGYAHFWISYRMTFEAAEKFICAEPYNERFPLPGRKVQFLKEVDATDPVAFIENPRMKFFNDFESLLKAAGGTYRKKEVDSFTVYYDFVPPYGSSPLREIPSAGWKVEASVNAGQAGQAVDGDRRTVWDSGAAQASGMVYRVDLGATQAVCKIRFDLGEHIMDSPEAYQVDVSTDGVQWAKAVARDSVGGDLYWEGSHPRFLFYGDHFTAAFAPVRTRYVRITLTRPSPREFWWSIAELQIYSPAESAATP
jgi:hypothetical protein